MNKSVIIIGASGHGKVVADIVKAAGDTVLCFLDDYSKSKQFVGLPVMGKCSDYLRFPEAEYVIAIGDAKKREKIVKSMNGIKWYTAIHPSAVISNTETKIGDGTVVMANAVINSGASIGKHCIINTGAIVEHDNHVGNYVHVSVGAKLGGNVTIGNYTWIGIGATVSNNIDICDDCMIGAGAVLVGNISRSGTYIGVPARIMSLKA